MCRAVVFEYPGYWTSRTSPVVIKPQADLEDWQTALKKTLTWGFSGWCEPPPPCCDPLLGPFSRENGFILAAHLLLTISAAQICSFTPATIPNHLLVSPLNGVIPLINGLNGL